MFLRLLLLLSLIAFCMAPSAASAHRSLFFAYMDGDDIVCEGGFPGGGVCKGCPIRIIDAANGTELAKGRTDDSGVLRIPLPEKAKQALYGMKIIIDAGEGHRAEWLLDPEEYLAASQLPETAQQPDLTVPRSERAKAAPAKAKFDANALRRVVAEAVDEALQKNLTPIRRELAASRDKGVSAMDIIGGMGWIVGLAGLVAWIRSRSYS